MAQQKSWVMSAIVVGTYVCAIYGARGTAVSARPLVTRPGVRVVRTPATQPTAVCSIDR